MQSARWTFTYAFATCLAQGIFVSIVDAGERSIEWEFEISNETYVQTGLDQDEFPPWTIVDLELYAEGSMQLSSEYTLFGGAKVGAGYDANEREGELEEYYIGLEYNGYRFGYGAKEYATEEFDLSLEVDLGRQTDFEQIEDRGQEVLFFQTERDDYELGFSFDFSDESSSLDAFASTKINETFTILTAYQRFRSPENTEVINTAGIMLLTRLGEWELVNSISNNRLTTSVDMGVQREFTNGNKLALSCGVEHLKLEARDKNTICFANFAYKVSDYLFVNAEIGSLNTDEADGVGFLIGIEFEYE